HVLPVMLVPEPLRFLPDHLFSPFCGNVSGPKRSIGRQPDIDVRQIREVFWKILRMQHSQEYPAQNQDGQRTRKHAPAMPQSKITHFIVETGKSMRASLGHGRLSLLRRLDEVVGN